MKNPLHYQMTEYDCGPTSMLNAVSYLFEREEISPDIIRNIMLYCLDCFGSDGASGKSGTSRMAMMFLSNWLNGFGQAKLMPIKSKYISSDEVYIGQNSLINDAITRGGVAVVRLYYETEHYVLFTKAKNEKIYMFDPYYHEDDFNEADIKITKAFPFEYNTIVPEKYFNNEGEGLYSLGEKSSREAVLLFNKNKMLTDTDTIEYFI